MTKQGCSINRNNPLDLSLDDMPKRKPIGWNYQNVYKAPAEDSKISSDDSPFLNRPSKMIKLDSSPDDIEVLEVLETTEKPKTKLKLRPFALFPPSSSRQEIREIVRGTSQSSIERFFPKKESSNGNESSSTSKSEDNIPTNKDTRVNSGSGNEDLKPLNTHSGKEKDEKNLSTTSSQKNYSANLFKSSEAGDESDASSSSRKTTSHSEPKEKDPHLNGHEEEAASESLEKKEEPITSEYSKSVVDKFMERWKEVKTFSKDDHKIKDKVWKNYYACHTSYSHSRKFINGLNKGVDSLNKENLYVFISDIIESLKRYKEVPFIEKRKKEEQNEEGEKDELSDPGEAKRRRKMAKIEKEMIKISKEINRLEEEDVDLDDEVNSSYLILERLKSQFVKLDEYYCKIANCVVSTGRPVEKKFKYEGSRYPEINKRITAWVNKNRCFPEYMDILHLVKNITNRNDLPMRPETVRVQAQEIFREVGKILKDRRERDDMFSIYAYVSNPLGEDPAEVSPDLKEKLKENEKDAREKLDKVFQHFVDKEAEYREKEDQKRENKKHCREQKAKEEGSKTVKTEGPTEENDEKEPPEKENEETDKIELLDEEQDKIDFEKLSEDSVEMIATSEEEIEDIETENEDEEHDYDDSSSQELNVISENSEKVEESLNGEVKPFDDSDSDIQEIDEILRSAVNYEDDPEEDDEDEEKDYYTDEDVEIALTPPAVSFGEERKLPNPDGAVTFIPVPVSTTFFRRNPDTNSFSHEKDEEPEIVELD